MNKLEADSSEGDSNSAEDSPVFGDLAMDQIRKNSSANDFDIEQANNGKINPTDTNANPIDIHMSFGNIFTSGGQF